jgi:hypothetical protein
MVGIPKIKWHWLKCDNTNGHGVRRVRPMMVQARPVQWNFLVSLIATCLLCEVPWYRPVHVNKGMGPVNTNRLNINPSREMISSLTNCGINGKMMALSVCVLFASIGHWMAESARQCRRPARACMSYLFSRGVCGFYSALVHKAEGLKVIRRCRLMRLWRWWSSRNRPQLFMWWNFGKSAGDFHFC